MAIDVKNKVIDACMFIKGESKVSKHFVVETIRHANLL